MSRSRWSRDERHHRSQAGHDPALRGGRDRHPGDGDRGGAVPRGAGPQWGRRHAGAARLRRGQGEAREPGGAGPRREGGARGGAEGAARVRHQRRGAPARCGRHRGGVRRGRDGEGHRRLEGPGLPGRREALRLRRRPGEPRQNAVPEAGVGGTGDGPPARDQGQADAGPHGRAADHTDRPHGRQGGRGAEPALRAGGRAGPGARHRDGAEGGAVSDLLEVVAYTAAGEPRARAVKLPSEPFDGRVHEAAMHDAVKAFLANQRQGTAKAKTRGYVSGGNQKPWKQKGTGRARQGSIRAPNWPGGGTVFGPHGDRNYSQTLPRQVRQLARKSALNARARDNAVLVIDQFAYDAPKTSQLHQLLARLGVAHQNVLILTDGVKTNVYLSGRNLPKVRVMP